MRKLKEEIERLMQMIARALEDEDILLKYIPGNWVTNQPGEVMKGICSRREPHLVFAAAARLREEGYVVVLEDGYDGHKFEHRLRCDLAVRLKTTGRWLWLEFKSVPMKNANDMLASAGRDVRKLTSVSTPEGENLPHGIVLVGFEPAGGKPQKNLGARWEEFAADYSLTGWPIQDIVPFETNSGTDWYTHCSVAYWVRLTKEDGTK